MAELIVTIDGPAASGKSTVARLLAEKLDASFLDTGAMYRAVTLAAMQAGVDLSDEQELLEIARKCDFQFTAEAGKMTVRLDNVDVTERIRDPEVTANARYIAGAPDVRAELVRMQRRLAADREKVVTEGRDQGTVAFADADVKFFLTADPAERARRRQAELKARLHVHHGRRVPRGEGVPPLCSEAVPTSVEIEQERDALATNGGDQSLEQIQRAIEERDKSDRSRDVGPLKPAEDAIVVDTTALTIDGVVKKLLMHLKERCSKNS
jgi:cytidylate kinase